MSFRACSRLSPPSLLLIHPRSPAPPERPPSAAPDRCRLEPPQPPKSTLPQPRCAKPPLRWRGPARLKPCAGRRACDSTAIPRIARSLRTTLHEPWKHPTSNYPALGGGALDVLLRWFKVSMHGQEPWRLSLNRPPPLVLLVLLVRLVRLVLVIGRMVHSPNEG
jgi:hypothetical protein